MTAVPRVLILTPRLETIGGVENYYNALELHRDDERIDYFPVTGPGSESTFQLGLRLVRNYWRFWKRLRTGQYRLVVLNPTLDGRSFPRDAVFCWLAQAHNRRVVVFFRGWDPAFEARVRGEFWPSHAFKRTFARCRNFIVLGRIFQRKLLELGCSADSRFWIESTVADTTYLSNFSIESRLQAVDPLRLLFLARLTRSKGPWVALEAFEIAQRRRPEMRLELVIAGPGPELPALEARIRDHGIRSVTLTGPVRDAAKADLLSSSHVLLHPTASDEGLPNSILEAMLYGMPVLATAVGAIPEVVAHEANGFVADSPDPELLADWIVRLADDPELRQRIARTNHEQAARLYTDQQVRVRVKAIIEECLRNGTDAHRHGSPAADPAP